MTKVPRVEVLVPRILLCYLSNESRKILMLGELFHTQLYKHE